MSPSRNRPKSQKHNDIESGFTSEPRYVGVYPFLKCTHAFGDKVRTWYLCWIMVRVQQKGWRVESSQYFQYGRFSWGVGLLIAHDCSSQEALPMTGSRHGRRPNPTTNPKPNSNPNPSPSPSPNPNPNPSSSPHTNPNPSPNPNPNGNANSNPNPDPNPDLKRA